MVLAFIAAASAFTASTGTAEQMARVEERLRNFMQTNGIAEKTALCMGLAPDGTIAGAITELMKNNVDGGGPAAELEADFQAAQTDMASAFAGVDMPKLAVCFEDVLKGELEQAQEENTGAGSFGGLVEMLLQRLMDIPSGS
mmetsp:Transcript_22871/g.67802  ORF Transcript_22871/g.67802 Transcript_22871/m.67802 type:complete len:142 (-) Transcript_22871:757-1182(-)